VELFGSGNWPVSASSQAPARRSGRLDFTSQLDRQVMPTQVVTSDISTTAADC